MFPLCCAQIADLRRGPLAGDGEPDDILAFDAAGDGVHFPTEIMG